MKAKRASDDRNVRMGMYLFKHNIQEWRLKAALCKAVLERQDFRRIRAFKILHNFTKLGRFFFRVVIGCVLRKEHFHRQLFFIKLKQVHDAHDAETRRMATGFFDLMRIQKAADYTKLQKPLLSLLSRGLRSMSSSFNRLRCNALEQVIDGSRHCTEKSLDQIAIMRSRFLKDNPVLYTLVSANLHRKSMSSSKILCSLALKVLRKANQDKKKANDLCVSKHAAKILHVARNKHKLALAALLLEKNGDLFLEALARRNSLAIENNIAFSKNDQLARAIETAQSNDATLQQQRLLHWIVRKKMLHTWQRLLDVRFSREVSQMTRCKAVRRLAASVQVVINRKLQEAMTAIRRSAVNAKKVQSMRALHWRRLMKASFGYWHKHSKRDALAMRKTFSRVFQSYECRLNVAFKRFKLMVVANSCNNLLEQIEIMNENLAESNQSLLEQTQENFQLENDLKYRSTRKQRSLLTHVMKNLVMRQRIEARRCMLVLSEFSNFTRKSVFLLEAAHRAFTKNCSGAFYKIHKESIIDLERFLVQQIKNFRDETAEQMVEREDLNQQTLAFVEERNTFEITTKNLARRLKTSSQNAALKALAKAKFVEEKAVLRNNLRFWRGKRRRLEILRSYLDQESRQFAARQKIAMLRNWNYKVTRSKKFKLAFEKLLVFFRKAERNRNGYGMRMIADRSFEMEQFHLSKLIDQANKKIMAASESELRSKLSKMTALVVRLIESRKVRLFEKFFDVTIHDYKRKLIAETRVRPLAEKTRFKIISEAFANCRKCFLATKTKKKLADRTLTRQKLYILKILQTNVLHQRQVKMACRYFDSVISYFQESRQRLAFSNIADRMKQTYNHQRQSLATIKLAISTAAVFRKQMIISSAKIFKKVCVPKKSARPLAITLGSLVKRKMSVAFTLMKQRPPNDNIVGRYILASYRNKEPLPKLELVSRAFRGLKVAAKQASRRLKGARLVISIVAKRTSPSAYLQRWNLVAQMEGMLTRRATPQEVLMK